LSSGRPRAERGGLAQAGANRSIDGFPERDAEFASALLEQAGQVVVRMVDIIDVSGSVGKTSGGCSLTLGARLGRPPGGRNRPFADDARFQVEMTKVLCERGEHSHEAVP